MLQNLDIKKLYLIDPYEGYWDGGKDNKFRGPAYMRKTKITMKHDLENYKDKIKNIYAKSSDAIKDIPDNIDFIYIDGDHSYEAVSSDINLYYNKVRKGGIFGGDDYKEEYPGSMKAVDEFENKYGVKVIKKECKRFTQKNELGYVINCNWMLIKWWSCKVILIY